MSAGCLALTTGAAIMWMIDITDIKFKIGICSSLFTVAFLTAFVYFFFFAKREKLIKACSDLSSSF